MAMALPKLPKLGTQMVAAPSGNGWGFTPDRGWGADFSTSDFLSGGGGGLPGGGGGNGGGPSFTWDIGVGGVSVSPGGGTGTPGGVRNTVSQAATAISSFWNIPWSRIAAFLLGLLLILGGIYLMRPVQQAVNGAVRDAAKGAAL